MDKNFTQHLPNFKGGIGNGIMILC